MSDSCQRTPMPSLLLKHSMPHTFARDETETASIAVFAARKVAGTDVRAILDVKYDTLAPGDFLYIGTSTDLDETLAAKKAPKPPDNATASPRPAGQPTS